MLTSRSKLPDPILIYPSSPVIIVVLSVTAGVVILVSFIVITCHSYYWQNQTLHNCRQLVACNERFFFYPMHMLEWSIWAVLLPTSFTRIDIRCKNYNTQKDILSHCLTHMYVPITLTSKSLYEL